MFKQRPNPTTSVSVIQGLAPQVFIDTDALTKMQLFVQECTDEIGWLGTAYRDEKNNITINDVFLFDQEVHATTTEITPDGLASFGEAILSLPEGMDIWNNLKMWGHSHVNMGVTPSGQDNDQMRTFAQTGHDWFIRLIANKSGDMKLDVYDYEKGITFTDVAWFELPTNQEWELRKKIKEMETELQAIRSNVLDAYKEPIKEEMRIKVRKKTYGNVQTRGSNFTGTPGSNYQTWWEKEESKKKAQVEPKQATLALVGNQSTGTSTLYTDEDDVLYGWEQWFTLADCYDILSARDDDEIMDYLFAYFGLQPSQGTLDIIKLYAKHEVEQHQFGRRAWDE